MCEIRGGRAVGGVGGGATVVEVSMERMTEFVLEIWPVLYGTQISHGGASSAVESSTKGLTPIGFDCGATTMPWNRLLCVGRIPECGGAGGRPGGGPIGVPIESQCSLGSPSVEISGSISSTASPIICNANDANVVHPRCVRSKLDSSTLSANIVSSRAAIASGKDTVPFPRGSDSQK